MINFTMQDVLGTFVGFILYSFIMIAPGYVLGWVLNVFSFRERLPPVQYLIGIVLSNVFSPILFFLTYFYFGSTVSIIVMFVIVISWVCIVFLHYVRKESPSFLSTDVARYQNIALSVGIGWVVISIFLLIDIQIGQRLYFNTASYDYTTRIAVIDAITRTGVPPVNPGYFPGHPVLLTMLYYFWYVLGSLVDQLGGYWVNPQQAMIASVAWNGITLMATLVLYLRLRKSNFNKRFWRASILIPQLLLLSGLDAIPVLMISIAGRIALGFVPLAGFVEDWNMAVMSWLNAVTWVPHHVAGALACITALMTFLYAVETNRKHLPLAALISGTAFASAVGLSMWTMFVFAFFWIIWMALFFLKKDFRVAIWMGLAAVLGVILVLPFLVGVFQSGNVSGDGSSLPINFFVRPFVLSKFFSFFPNWVVDSLNLLFLPINYLFELGFYFAIALLWIKEHKSKLKVNPYFMAEGLLLVLVTILLSFMRSTIIVINDLGIRGWLFGQFILVIWAVDVLWKHMGNKNLLSISVLKRVSSSAIQGMMLTLMFVVGLLTTGLEIVSLRGWPILIDLNVAGFPSILSSDTQLGNRTFSARQAYQVVSENISEDVVVQYNPNEYLDRPSGLYGNHQMAIADRTSYGVPVVVFKSMVEDIGTIFETEHSTWNEIDSTCNRYSIGAIILNDTDPLWSNLEGLESIRSPLYKNPYYAVFSCGLESQ